MSVPRTSARAAAIAAATAKAPAKAAAPKAAAVKARPAGPLDCMLFALARRGRLPDGLRNAYRRLLGTFAGRSGLDVATRDGLLFRCHPFENRDDFEIVAKRRLPEVEERDWLASHLKPGDVLVDIGANVGSHTISLAKRVPGLKVLAIEPNLAIRERLRENLALNAIEPSTVTVAPVAIGPIEARGRLCKRHRTNAGSASLKPPAGEPEAALAESIQVTVEPLAAVLKRFGIRRIDALKIDVEGYEDEALIPFLETASPALLPKVIEIETAMSAEWRTDVVAALVARGYRIDRTTAENAMLVRTAAPAGGRA